MSASIGNKKNAPIHTPAKSSHVKRSARLARLGSIECDVIALLEQQESNAFGAIGLIPAVPILKMESDMWMHDTADFSDFVQACRIGLADRAPSEVLYVEVHFSDEREPGTPPIRMAATLHLGGILAGDDE